MHFSSKLLALLFLKKNFSLIFHLKSCQRIFAFVGKYDEHFCILHKLKRSKEKLKYPRISYMATLTIFYELDLGSCPS